MYIHIITIYIYIYVYIYVYIYIYIYICLALLSRNAMTRQSWKTDCLARNALCYDLHTFGYNLTTTNTGIHRSAPLCAHAASRHRGACRPGKATNLDNTKPHVFRFVRLLLIVLFYVCFTCLYYLVIVVVCSSRVYNYQRGPEGGRCIY